MFKENCIMEERESVQDPVWKDPKYSQKKTEIRLTLKYFILIGPYYTAPQ